MPMPGWDPRSGAGALVALATVALIALALPQVAQAKPEPWPPRDLPGTYYVHYGEEHVNDEDGATILPVLVRESARYRPAMVAMSGDKVNDGRPEELQLWADVMEIYDRNGVPWFAAVGNHDRKAPPGMPGGVSPLADLGPYMEFFADRPYPMGDAPGYRQRGFSQRRPPAGNPEGAASHYYVDHGRTRWIFVDNSCWSIIACDVQQNPTAQTRPGETQLQFLERVGREAKQEGRFAFAVMHMPTRDPGDQIYREPIAVQHTMGKTVLGVLDNEAFERSAMRAGLDAVFVAHIKGQFMYRGQGGIPYFINGGGGGELYSTGPEGTDHGYWHGFQLLRVTPNRVQTDNVPIFLPGELWIEGPRALESGVQHTFAAFGSQPVFEHHIRVQRLALRDPDPTPRLSGGLMGWVGGWGIWLAPIGGTLLLLLVVRLATMPRRRWLAVPALVCGGALAAVGVAGAQGGAPTSTPVEALPNPARIWTTSDARILRPARKVDDDPRRDRRTQTTSGTFRAACPGHARLRITSGFEHAGQAVTVRSERGPIVRDIRRGVRSVQAGGRDVGVAQVRLDQRARVAAVVKRGGRTVARLGHGCRQAGATNLSWDGTVRSRGRPAPPGSYRVLVRVLSDRDPVRRGFRVNVR